jgi:DNA invertase Pin-like site-specific DNA recombinase
MLTKLIGQLVNGDRLIVAALDRLGRRTSEVLRLIEDLESLGIVLISEREGVDYSTPVGRLVTQILVSVAEMERAMIAERTRAGLKAAREKGRIGGRPSSYSKDQLNAALELFSQGLTSREIAAKTGISYSYLNLLRKTRARTA